MSAPPSRFQNVKASDLVRGGVLSLKEMVKTFSCGDKPLYITNPYSLSVPRKCSAIFCYAPALVS